MTAPMARTPTMMRELLAGDVDVKRLRGNPEGVHVDDIGGDRPVDDQQDHGDRQGSKAFDDQLAGVGGAVLGGEAGTQDAKPHDGKELPEHADSVELVRLDALGNKTRVVRCVGEPADAPADADRGHDRGHCGDARHAGEDLADRALVGPVDVELCPGEDRHGDQHDDGRRHGDALEARNGLVAAVADGHLDGHDDRGGPMFQSMLLAVGSTQPIMPNRAMIRSRMTQVLTADHPMAMTAWMAAGR